MDEASVEIEYPEGSIGAELERLRADVDELWFPFRWYLSRKLDRIVRTLDEARDEALRRYPES